MDDDPPLFAALQAFYRRAPRHELREDRRVTDYSYDAENYGAGRYGADDDPDGPPAPPLDAGAPAATTGIDLTDVEWRRRYEPAPPPDPVPDIAVCPTCGTAVDRTRIRV